MHIVIMIGQLLLGLSILVAIHEFGHFLAARAFGMRVDKFFIFFNVKKTKIFSFKKGHTEYGIGIIPLGGYVKIAGMIDESMDKEQMKKPPQPWEFRSKPPWQRLIVMVSGVIMNLFLGIFIFSLITFFYGEKYYPIKDNDPAIVSMDYGDELGFQTGDTLLKINNTEYKNLKRFEDIFSFTLLLAKNANVTVLRNGEIENIRLPVDFTNKIVDKKNNPLFYPRIKFSVKEVSKKGNAIKADMRSKDKILKVDSFDILYFDQLVKALNKYKNKKVPITVLRKNDTIILKDVGVNEDGLIGIVINDERKKDSITYGFFQSFTVGNSKAWNMLRENTLGFKKIFEGDIDPRKAVGGPLKIAQMYGPVWNWQNFWWLTGLLSLILAFMNILPIPALDGGHVITIFIEMITGKPLGIKTMEVIQTIGIIIVIALMIFVIFNDAIQIFF